LNFTILHIKSILSLGYNSLELTKLVGKSFMLCVIGELKLGGLPWRTLRAPLDEGRTPKVQWNRAIPLLESHKLDPLKDEGTSLKSGKSRLNLHDSILEGKSIGLDPQTKKPQSRAHDLENGDAS
jgi:hypothetical protein